MLHFVVGPMGAGKNYVGERLADKLQCNFVDGDTFIPAEMANKVARFKSLTLQDIDSFVTDSLIPQVEAAYTGQPLVVAQALYRQQHRDQIANHFGNQCIFYRVKTPLLVNLKRLYSRENGFRWCLYGLSNFFFFQHSDGLIIVDNP